MKSAVFLLVLSSVCILGTHTSCSASKNVTGTETEVSKSGSGKFFRSDSAGLDSFADFLGLELDALKISVSVPASQFRPFDGNALASASDSLRVILTADRAVVSKKKLGVSNSAKSSLLKDSSFIQSDKNIRVESEAKNIKLYSPPDSGITTCFAVVLLLLLLVLIYYRLFHN